jgi:hypothetical protein
VPADGYEALRALERALRRMLGNADGGRLRFDLASALVDATIEVLDNHVQPAVEPDEDDDLDGERSITLADLNAMFALSLGEGSSLALDRFDIQTRRRERGHRRDRGFPGAGMGSHRRHHASSPEGTATMMSDGGIGLYEFTVDDGVYFFTHAALDVEEPQWWFAHTVTDAETRTGAITAGRAAIGASDDAD